MLSQFRWRRSPDNPVLPPRPGSDYDSTRCMNPFVVRAGDEYRLYYSGGDDEGRQRICLATAKLSDPTTFTRHGVVLDTGTEGAFDARWCVLPCVHRMGDQWFLYYSGREGTDLGLQSFPGIGLTVSDDGLHFEKHSVDPVITGDQTREYPRNRGVAGGGRSWRMVSRTDLSCTECTTRWPWERRAPTPGSTRRSTAQSATAATACTGRTIASS